MSKKIFSLLLALMLVVSMFAIATVSVSADVDADGRYVPSAGVETNRYYFLMPDDWYNELTSDAGIYWWDATDAPASWQDMYKAHKDAADGVFYVDCPKDVTAIIWTNMLDAGDGATQEGVGDKAKQTVNIPSEYYDPGESDLYPDGLPEGFNNMIYVCTNITEVENELTHLVQKVYAGDWYFYYGNGQYGTDPNGSATVEPTAPAVPTGTVNGQEVHVGDVVTYTAKLTADEKLVNFQATVKYDESVLQLRKPLDCEVAFPVDSDVVYNENLTGEVKFNDSKLKGIDFTTEGVFVTLTFDVVAAADTTITTVIEEMNSVNDKVYAADSERVNDFSLVEEVSVECTHPTTPAVTDPATTTPAAEQTTTVASEDEAPTTTPNQQGGSTGDPNGAVSTGDVSFAVVLLAVLVAATGAMFVVRKRVNG